MQVIKVVVLSLFITDLLELTDIIKAISIQNILSEEAVETLYISILHRFAKLCIPDFYKFPFATSHKCLGDKLQAIITSDVLRCTNFFLQIIRCFHNCSCRITKSYIYSNGFAVSVINNIKHTRSSTITNVSSLFMFFESLGDLTLAKLADFHCDSLSLKLASSNYVPS